MSESGPCCACTNIIYRRQFDEDNENLVIAEWRECSDCGQKFVPQIMLERKNNDSARVSENLAAMLRRMIWTAKKETGDTGMKVLAGKAGELLKLYGLEGSPLRDEEMP